MSGCVCVCGVVCGEGNCDVDSECWNSMGDDLVLCGCRGVCVG